MLFRSRAANARMHAMQMGPVINALRRAMRSVYKPVGGVIGGKLQRYTLFRKPNGSVVYMNKKGIWQPYVPTELYTNFLQTWYNANGSAWIFIDGKWHQLKKKPNNNK